MIETDVIESDIPLLLSQASMKRANMNLNFKEDSTSVFGETIDLVVTKSGHYTVSYYYYRNNKNVNVTLPVHSTKDKDKIAIKLHHHFAMHQMTSLINSN